MENSSLFAADYQWRLDSEQDALEVIYGTESGLIFRLADIAPGFFDLKNGLAGAVFQKFMNYRRQVVFVLPTDHTFGNRVTELAKEHARHPYIRIVASDDEAVRWLQSQADSELYCREGASAATIVLRHFQRIEQV